MKIKPLKDRVLIKLDKVEKISTGGIIIPESVGKEKTRFGTVVSTGDHESIPANLVGQRIMYDVYAGIPVKDGDDEYLILNVKDLIAVIE